MIESTTKDGVTVLAMRHDKANTLDTELCQALCQVRRRLAARQAGRQVEGATRVILDEIRAMGPQLAELCRKYGIAELSVFGSVARGDAQPGSDVDLLYVRVPGNDLGMSYFALQEDLEKLFGRPVDLVPKEGLHWVIRDQVLSDAQVLYAA